MIILYLIVYPQENFYWILLASHIDFAAVNEGLNFLKGGTEC